MRSLQLCVWTPLMIFSCTSPRYFLSLFLFLQCIHISSVESQKGIIITMLQWEPEGRYCCTKSMAIAPFWFSMEHCWTALMSFWSSADDFIFPCPHSFEVCSHSISVSFSFSWYKCVHTFCAIHMCVHILFINAISVFTLLHCRTNIVKPVLAATCQFPQRKLLLC